MWQILVDLGQLADKMYKTQIAAQRGKKRAQVETASLREQIAAKGTELDNLQKQLANMASAPIAPEVAAANAHREEYTRYFVSRFGRRAGHLAVHQVHGPLITPAARRHGKRTV